MTPVFSPMILHIRTVTYHLTLAQRHNSMPVNTKIWKLPLVRYARDKRTRNKPTNAPSKIARIVEFVDEPGVRKWDTIEDPAFVEVVEAFSSRSNSIATSEIVGYEREREVRQLLAFPERWTGGKSYGCDESSHNNIFLRLHLYLSRKVSRESINNITLTFVKVPTTQYSIIRCDFIPRTRDPRTVTRCETRRVKMVPIAAIHEQLAISR
jgi:hypothetical protein